MSTPVQRQYQDLKKENPKALLFFRLGDFYELFFEDAQIASRVLGITLTARHKGTDNEMPMAGVPYHAHKEYLEGLLAAGYQVAVAEQKEEEGKISRYIARVITAGTSQQESLDPQKNNYLVGLAKNSKTDSWGISITDLSTGEFRTSEFDKIESLLEEVHRVNPSEILVESPIFEDQDFCQKLPQVLITPRTSSQSKTAQELLQDHFGLSNLESFGLSGLTIQIEVAGMVLLYLSETQKTALPHIQKITPYSVHDFMVLDQQTMRHLEIFAPLYGTDNGATLMSVFLRPFTAMGGRRLRDIVAHPLLSLDQIKFRQEAVAEFYSESRTAESLEESFKQIHDLERIIARIGTGIGKPSDIGFLRNSLQQIPKIKTLLGSLSSPFSKEQKEAFEGLDILTQKLDEILVESPPLESQSGGIFAEGYNQRLDELRLLSLNAKEWLDNYLKSQKEETGISNLRIKFSKNFGFCIETSKSNADKTPAHWTRRQTLVNAERYTTPELAEYETKVLSAEGEAFELEYNMFCELREEVISFTPEIQKSARAIGWIDALLSLARTALEYRWEKPLISEVGPLNIKEGRHPVIEKLSNESFVSNSLALSSSEYVHLITGPNMAGKSTYLRQNALIILLGQMGGFVPAKESSWGIVDRVFTRVGASDYLAGGKSTFFVEMSETASILNLATEKSFIILDEIGRGTSTFDGISLAWAITEFLHDKIKAKTLFATHYHELTDLAERLPAANNFHVSVTQNDQGIIFLRKIKKGGISDSFGIEVAKLSGIPSEVISTAREILLKLESDTIVTKYSKPSLFNLEENVEPKEALSPSQKSKLESIEKINPDELSPKEALEWVYSLRNL